MLFNEEVMTSKIERSCFFYAKQGTDPHIAIGLKFTKRKHYGK